MPRRGAGDHALRALLAAAIACLVLFTVLRVLETDDEVSAARVLAGCAVRRVDPEYVRQHAEAWLALMDRVDDRAGFVEVLLPALSLGLPESWAATAVEVPMPGRQDLRLAEMEMT